MAMLRAARSFRLPGFGEPVTFKSATYLQTRSFIQLKTKLQVADNSGAKRVECIKVVGGGKGAKIGDIIIASVKEITHRVRSTRKGDTKDGNKVKKGDVVYGVVVRGAMQRPRSDGSQIKFEENAVVLINKQGEPIGTRVFGPVAAELRERKLVKVLALAEHVV